VSDELFALLETADRLHLHTGGAFDPTATPLSKSWGFLRREGRRPAPAEIDEARARTGMGHVARDPAARTVRYLKPGLELSFGSLGKGHALDVMAEALKQRGVPKALLSAGGSSLLAFGGGSEGFPVSVTSPRMSGTPLFRLRLREAAQATSGAGVQYFDVEGQRFGHVIDPRTGWPARGVLSATVVTRSAAEADALSTAFFVAGPELAEAYCADHPDTMALLVPEDDAGRRLVFGSCKGALREAV
jgi:thiamine biosynthesis lipoprotein